MLLRLLRWLPLRLLLGRCPLLSGLLAGERRDRESECRKTDDRCEVAHDHVMWPYRGDVTCV